MTYQTALTKLDSLTWNQIRHFINFLEKEIEHQRQIHLRYAGKFGSWKNKKPEDWVAPRELVRAKEQFEKQLTIKSWK